MINFYQGHMLCKSIYTKLILISKKINSIEKKIATFWPLRSSVRNNHCNRMVKNVKVFKVLVCRIDKLDWSPTI